MSRKTRVDITYALVGRGQKTMLKDREPFHLGSWYSILSKAVYSVGEGVVCPNSSEEDYYLHEIEFQGLFKSGAGLFLRCRCTHCGIDFKHGDDTWFDKQSPCGIIRVPHLTSTQLQLRELHRKAREEYRAEHGRYPEEDGVCISVKI